MDCGRWICGPLIFVIVVGGNIIRFVVQFVDVGIATWLSSWNMVIYDTFASLGVDARPMGALNPKLLHLNPHTVHI